MRDSRLSQETFKKALRDPEILIRGKKYGKGREVVGASSAPVCIMFVFYSFCWSSFPYLIQVIWSYVGFSNANYALSEMHNPGRTLRIAGPLAIITVTVFYLLCNIAYFAAASKEEITGSGRLVAALLFKNVWGEKTERVLNGFVALSALGNVLSVVRDLRTILCL